MPLIPIAVLMSGAWLVIDSQEVPSETLTLVFGIVIAVLALIDLLLWAMPRLRQPR